MRNHLTGGFALILVALLADAGLGVWNLLAPADPGRATAVVWGLIALLAATLLGFGLFLLRPRSERPSQAMEEQLRAFVESGVIGVMTGDIHGNVTDANDEYLRILGYTRKDLRQGGVRWSDLTPPEWLSVDEQHIIEARQNGVSTRYEKEYVRRDGNRIAVLIGFVLLGEAREQAVAFVLDLTDRKNLEAELRGRADELAEADRRKDEFLAMLGHELRNPLAPVRNAVAILGMPHVGPAHLEQARAMIERQVQQMTRLVDDLLDVSRITRNKINLRRDRLDLAGLVRAAVEDQRPVVARAGLALALEAPKEPAWVEGDAVRLTQVVDNLLHNAMKFTDKGGRIDVRVVADAGARRVTVTIRDTGIGIEAAMLPRLFDSFAQADRSLERSRDGLGLGLALVRGLVGLHGGGVRADSDGVGRGSEFTFFLPLTEAPELVETPAKSATNGARRRVLLIEDNRDAADSLRLLLQMSGHEVAVAYTGTDGVETAGRLRPDVVLCDIGLPGLSGYDIARALRQREATTPALLVALSGYGSDEDQRRSRDAGFHFHLVKPVNPEEVEQLIQAATAVVPS